MIMGRTMAGALAAVALAGAAGDGANAAAIDLARYEQTFADEFDALSVSAWGPGTTWIAHTPWNGDFGDAKFADPKPGFPFTVDKGILRIEVSKRPDGKWRGGLIASVDPSGNGFSQQYGYFEMRAKFPAGAGLWPAFWLIGLDRTTHTSEIDVVEHHGHMPAVFSSAVHTWNRKEPAKTVSKKKQHAVPEGALSAGFNLYGVSVAEDWTVIYFNREEVWRTPTPPEHRQKMYLLVDLGMGGGWPIDKTPSPSFMHVDYVRAYALK